MTSVFNLFATDYISQVTSVLIETHVHKWAKLHNTQDTHTLPLSTKQAVTALKRFNAQFNGN